jgi:hypothetical protein
VVSLSGVISKSKIEGEWEILWVRIDNNEEFFDLGLDETLVSGKERVALRPAKGRRSVPRSERSSRVRCRFGWRDTK